MALLFLDGFEEYDSSNEINWWNEASAIQAHNGVKYCYRSSSTNLVPSTTQVRTAQNGLTGKSLLVWAAVLGLKVPNVSTLYWGFGVYCSGSLTTSQMAGFCKDPMTNNCVQNPSTGVRININSNGTLALINNNTGSTIATSTLTITANAWYYIEIKYVFGSGTSGSVQVKVDGTDYLNVTSIDTAATAAFIDTIYFQCSNNGLVEYIDDVYVCDSSGATNNTFLGPISVYTLIPTANSATVDMTPSAGSNYACVDDIPPNTTDYVTATASNQVDLYGMSDLPGGVTATSVPGVLVKAKSMKPTANNGQIQLGTKYSGSSNFSASKAVTQTSYVGNFAIFESQPGGSAWDLTSINGLEAGIKSV